MTRAKKRAAFLWAALGVGLFPVSAAADASGNPYLEIVRNNSFRLKPPQRLEADLPAVPLAKVKLVGISTFGDKYALLKIYFPALPPEPARELSCVLTVGQREGPVELLEVDAPAAKVKVRNSGAVVVLTLENEKSPPPIPVRPSALVSPPMPSLQRR